MNNTKPARYQNTHLINKIKDFNPLENKDVIMDYPTAARSISLWLDDYCDKNLIYPHMIAEASRLAKIKIDELTREKNRFEAVIQSLQSQHNNSRKDYMTKIAKLQTFLARAMEVIFDLHKMAKLQRDKLTTTLPDMEQLIKEYSRNIMNN